ncbi:MAG: peptide chain release factor 2 [Defluviitaleaceae bacterium]|nr:peptide chain release factor 2 [Defluviitaleaceae bacterium]
MEMFEIKQQIKAMTEKMVTFKAALDLKSKEEQLKVYDDLMQASDFWDDQRNAQDVINAMNQIKSKVEQFYAFETKVEELAIELEMILEEQDDDLITDLGTAVRKTNDALATFELDVLLSDPHDSNNAILELHPGAGGTESQDWAEMLYRMYTRYAQMKGYKVELLDYQAGDEAGIKSVSFKVKGDNAYGFLKSERGVHRLVRISPFDSGGRRHTSFCSCDVMPEFEGEVQVDIKDEELKVDTYRASGAGGQHINTTDSAVRITHLPTGTVVTCQNQRSQIKNKEAALQMLKSKLYQLELDKQASELAEIRGEVKEIGWGSQIRSYVFHPYSLVKDNRTGYEVGNIGAVMDGALDGFIHAYLRKDTSKHEGRK